MIFKIGMNQANTRPKPRITQDFKNVLREYMTIKQQIKGGQQQIREWRRREEILAKQVMGFMEKNDMTDKEINGPEMRIKYKVMKKKSGCTQKHIKTRLVEFYQGNEDKAKEMWGFLQDGRTVTEYATLRTTQNTYDEDDDDEEDDD